MVKKECSLIEKWFSFIHKMTKEKMQYLTIKLTFEPQKGLKTAKKSTKKCSLV